MPQGHQLEVGSRPFLQGRIEDLADIYARIGEELASQYTLGSISRNPKRDGARRRVIVQEAPSGFEPEKEVLPFGLCSGVYAQKQVDPSKIGRFLLPRLPERLIQVSQALLAREADPGRCCHDDVVPHGWAYDWLHTIIRHQPDHA